MTRLLRTLLVALLAAPLPLTLGARMLHAAPSDERIRTAPLSVEGAPRSVVTISIPVPAQIVDADSITFVVEIRGSIEVLGRLSGDLQRNPITGEWRPVILSVRVPSDARQGMVEVADLTFTTQDARKITVPLQLQVPVVSLVRAEGVREYQNLRAADRLELPYRIHNLGNTVEHLMLRLRAPLGWITGASDSIRISVPAFSSTEVKLAVRIPVGTNGGEYQVAVSGVRDGADSAMFQPLTTTLRVAEPDLRASRGFVLRPMTAISASNSGSGLTFGLNADGDIAPGVNLRAQILPMAPRSGIEASGLASLGALGNPFQAALQAEHWSADIGVVSASLSPLTGINAVAEGVSGRARIGKSDASAFAGRSGLRGNATGSHVGGGFWTSTQFGRVGGSASVRKETFGATYQRELVALGADWSGAIRNDWTLDAGLAVRSFDGGEHLGYRLDGGRQYDRGALRFGFAHAPGGTAAFANGVNNLQVSLRHEINEWWRVDANAQGVRDAANGGLETRTSGFTLGQYFAYRPQTSFSLVASSASYEGTSRTLGVGRFGASTHLVSAGATHHWKKWVWTPTMQIGIVGRETQLASGALSEVRVLQQGLQVGASRSITTIGQLSAGVSRVITGAGAGQPTDVTSVYGRIGGLALMAGALPIRANTELQYIVSAFRPSALLARVGASTPLPGGMELAATFERNPFFLNRDGRAGWLVAMRVSAQTTIFTSRTAGETGLVFEDRNANGVRDLDEPGIAGVRLRQGEVRVTTDRRGGYTLPATVRGRLEVEAASLPMGLVLHPRVARALDESREFPLVPTGVLVLTLELPLDEEGRRPDVNLSLASAWLVDRDGREWVGRTLPSGELSFDNLPVGRYTVRLDGSRLSEPLRIVTGESVEVVAATRTPHVVQLRGRAVRLIQPPSRAGERSGRGSGRGRN